MPFSTIASFLKDGLKILGMQKAARRKNARRLRRIRQDVERCGELAHEVQRTKLTAPAYRLPTKAWPSVGGQLMDDGVLTEDEYRDINALFEFARQTNIAIDAADVGLHNPTPATGALLSRPLIKATHVFEGQPTPYDNALGAISRGLDRLR